MLAGIDKAGHFFTLLLPLLMLAGPAPADASAGLIVILFLIRTFLTRDASWLRPRWMQLLLLLWLFTSLRNLHDWDQLVRASTWLRYVLLAPALGLWTLQNPRTRVWLLRLLIASVAFLALDALWQYVHGFDITGRPLMPHHGGVRLTGPFSNPRVGITLLWLMFPALLWCMAHARRSMRYSGILLTLVATLAILASGERTALLLAIAGLAFSFILLPRARRALMVVALLGMAGGMAMIQANPGLQARQVHEMQHGLSRFFDSVYGRMWITSIEIAGDHPLLGVGSKQFYTVCSQPVYGPTDIARLAERCPMHPHNMYLEWLVEGGIPALLLWLAVLGCWASMAVRQRHVWRTQPLATGLLVACLLRFWPLAVETSQFVAWSAVPLWLMIGWMLALFYTPTTRTLDASA